MSRLRMAHKEWQDVYNDKLRMSHDQEGKGSQEQESRGECEARVKLKIPLGVHAPIMLGSNWYPVDDSVLWREDGTLWNGTMCSVRHVAITVRCLLDNQSLEGRNKLEWS